LYVIIAILNEKIEELFQFFNESQDIFVYISQFYQNTSNKKISELAKEIIALLNGVKKQPNITTNLNKENNLTNSNFNSQFKKLSVEDTNSNSDKNSSLSGDNKEKQSKFSFIKKKPNNTNEPEVEKKVEIENLITENKSEISSNEVPIMNDEKQINLANIANSSQSSSKFSFIKSKGVKKIEIPADLASNESIKNLEEKSKKKLN
jgi:hypothetical protein